ncbi:TPA: ATP-binding cassette domain-containing protein [Legionella pneumophila]|uniref:Peptidase domain-containing ABC transporter n=1 Tax=Legionella pneumophila TaxID=446 RepID=A0AAN5KS30_LEGPN|nr:peptidase domain-containing ABC transporter [Legionella pneumophila]HAT1972901.1 peptidase domain-containing ABC transporter [Legionella pneumophila]HAT6957457.1 ATP-binding cassette domain-containing protein [Legionella pneumophila]HEN4771216.1 peptidase domain-containing ABC transporter [Legionella pneumophila]
MIHLGLTLPGSRKKKLPVIRQDQFSECGHVCVAMISNYYGHKIDLPYLRALNEPSINGSTILDLMYLLEKLKFHTRPIRAELNELKRVQCPAILHWNMNHFVVLQSVGSTHVVIHDPALGRRDVSLSELSISFTGIVLEVEQTDDFCAIRSNNKLNLLNLFNGINGLKKSLIVLWLLSLIIEIFILINPIFLQYITDNVADVNSLNNLYVTAIGFIVLTLCHIFIEYMRSHFVVYLTNRMSEYFSSGVMNHLLRLPFEYFERRHRGDILSRFHSINEIQSKLTTDSINTLLDGIVILLALIIMSIYSLKLTCIVIFALSLYLILRTISYRHLRNQTEISVIEHANVNSKFLEIIQIIIPIKLYLKESTMYREWKNYFIKAMNADIKIARANIFYSTINLFLFNIEHILVIAIGATLVVQNQFSVGMLIAFLAYRQVLVNKTTLFIHKVFDYRLMSVQINRISDILMQPTERDDHHVLVNKEIEGDLKIKNLNYKYPGTSQLILNNINLSIKSGEKVVITGPSGIGKTTLLKIMLGLIVPTQGEVFIDGVSLKILGLKKYRSVCASVMQDDMLISGSILDNITFMDNKIDIDRVYQVARISQIHEDILNMPMSYETLIGDMGSSLSGGQKQRILIARALYKNPKILFLDEATSHLDVDTEIKINNALKQLKITQVVIAHRIESIKMADRIIDLS